MAIERWRPGWAIRPWQPFRELDEMERRFADIFGHQYLPSIWRRAPVEEKGWMPAIDVFEKEDKFVVKTELPGIKEEDIDISVPIEIDVVYHIADVVRGPGSHHQSVVAKTRGGVGPVQLRCGARALKIDGQTATPGCESTLFLPVDFSGRGADVA